MRLFLSSAVLLTIVSSVFGETCPEIVKGEKKFLVYKEKVNWFKALLNCSSQGMSLATIESHRDRDMIKAKIEESCLQDYFCHGHWWIGGTYLHGGGLIWFSTNQNMDYDNFKIHPNEDMWTQEEEHCVKVVQGYRYKWALRDCNNLHHFVCEYFE